VGGGGREVEEDKKEKEMMVKGQLVYPPNVTVLWVSLLLRTGVSNSAKLSHCLSKFINICYVVIESLLRRTHGKADNRMLENKLSVSLPQFFGLCALTVHPSLVVIRAVVGRGGGIRNCITQPSKVTNIINSLGDSSSLELRDQPSCLACMTFWYTDGFC
jgi:hypothetical protein